MGRNGVAPLIGVCMAVAGLAGAAELYVSPQGDDANPGSRSEPFASVERARDAIRALRQQGALPAAGVTVQVRGGVYELPRPLEFEEQDSGTAQSPIVYRAYRDEVVRLAGGRTVAGWTRVSDPGVLARLDPAAQGKVWCTDLRRQGITDLGELRSATAWANSDAGLEVFCDDKPMTVARWPNEGYARIADVVVRDGWNIFGIQGSKAGQFIYEGERPARWAGEPEAMLHGYWFWDWADQRYRLGGVDAAKHQITLDGGKHEFGFRKGQWYYAYNLLCELDRPGEWYLDRAGGLLYFWPPRRPSRCRVVVSVLPALISSTDTSHVTLHGLILEATRDTAVTIRGGEGMRLEKCVVRNAGSWAVRVEGGKGHALVGCDLANSGDGAVSLVGGERRTLAPAGHVVENCHIHHYGRWDPMYKPAVSLDGVGNRVAHCLIHDGPHAAILFSGNDHIIEFNEIHSVVYHSNDAGVIYAYHDWTKRGQVIRHNYIHHVAGYEGRGCNGVYLDNFVSGTTVSGNIFAHLRSKPASCAAVFVHGGRDNTIDNNLFFDCQPAVRVTTTGFWPAEKQRLLDALARVPYQEEPWRSRYPELVNILDDEPGIAKRNTVTRNLCWQGPWLTMESRAGQTATVADNLSDQDPRLVRPERGDFRLRPDSPAWAIGFQAIPVERIGLYRDALRASWPVRSAVRPVPPPPEPTQPQPHPTARSRAARAAVAPQVDGIIAPNEWPGAPLRLQETPGRQPSQGPPVDAWVCHADGVLYVALRIPVPDGNALKRQGTWGASDGAEVVLRDASGAKPGPTYAVRGFASGTHEGAMDSGAPEEQVRALVAATRYAVRVSATEWCAEWALPLAAAGIRGHSGLKLGFNLGALRTAGNEWLVWAGALGTTLNLDNGGSLVLE